MPVLLVRIVALLTTFLLFGTLGYRLSKRVKTPISITAWIFLALFTLLAGSIMPSAILIGIFRFKIFVSCSLMAFGIGIIIGLATRGMRQSASGGAKV